MKQRSFAVFDIDGTLIRWQLYHAVVDELARQQLIPAESLAAAKKARKDWKFRLDPAAFGTYELGLINAYDAALPALTVADLTKATETVFAKYHAQTYTFTRDLLADLKTKGYLLFAISASQVQIVELLAQHYGFDDWGGTRYELNGDHFTGEKHLLKGERKPEYLRELVVKHDATFAGSIGVGDTESDIPMLTIVEQPIAFNPNRALQEHARAQGWQIVVERKDMVYQLESRDGSYVLA